MKKILLILICFISVFAFASCDNENDTPEGMQLVYGSDADGYYFYVPEEWLVSNVGDIKAAYISRVNTSSVSFTEVKLNTDANKADYFFGSYFNEHLPELQKMPGFNLKVNGTPTTFGNGEYAATKAQQYIYTYKHQDYDLSKQEYLEYEFSFMQILVQKNDRFFIFTYSAQNTAEDDATPNYEKYLDKVKAIIEAFRFVGDGTPKDDTAEYVRDADGYILISDKKLSGFELYVPDSFKPSYSSAIVSATHADGSNINLSEASYTGIEANKYWEKREKDLSTFFTEVTVIQKEVDTELGNSDSLLYGNWDWIFEYTYVHSGEKYHVYQVVSIDGFNGYVFTYTAPEEHYNTHLDEILKVIEKVRF